MIKTTFPNNQVWDKNATRLKVSRVPKIAKFWGVLYLVTTHLNHPLQYNEVRSVFGISWFDELFWKWSKER